jgi:hypothetical protein
MIPFKCRNAIVIPLAIMCQAILLSVNAATELSGVLDSMTLTSEGNPFIVKENVTIPPTGKMTIKKGCQIFFRSSTGMIVEGSFSVEGTADAPVIFTSIHDSFSPEKSSQKPNPFDWNGILITNHTQNIVVKHFFIKYSIYGIESHNPNIVIDNGIFIGNGQFNCTVGNKIMPVVENISYSYSYNKKEKAAPVSQNHQSDKSNWIQPSAKIITAAGVATLGFMAYFLHQKGEYVDLYSSAMTQAKRREYYEKQKGPAQNAVICGIAGGIWLSTGGALFIMNHNFKRTKAIAIRPIIGDENGILASIEF